MAIIEAPREVEAPEPSFRERALDWMTTTDHKKIGILYLVTAFFFFVVAGIMALFIRAELAQPGLQIVDDQTYNQLFTMHGTLMIFLFVMPVFSGFVNFVMPLMIGAPDVAFPRIIAMSYWMAWPGCLSYSIRPSVSRADQMQRTKVASRVPAPAGMTTTASPAYGFLHAVAPAGGVGTVSEGRSLIRYQAVFSMYVVIWAGRTERRIASERRCDWSGARTLCQMFSAGLVMVASVVVMAAICAG